VVLVLLALAAPLWSEHVAHTGPLTDHLSLTDRVRVDGKLVPVVSDQRAPIGPTWRSHFFLGADTQGRDLMVRLLYGARTSLLIGVSAGLLTTLLATALGLIAGYFRGWIDAIVSRVLEVLWAFPAILLGIALGTALSLGGLSIGPIAIPSHSLLIPIVVIAVAYISYLARPVRGAVLALREREFVEAARAQGASSLRIIVREVLPNLASTVIVFFPLMVANAMLLEAALSFLGAGVQDPEPSWGSMLDEGVHQSLVHAPWVAICPGLMLVLTLLSLNVFGVGVREALDPRAKLRPER
jgi:peptide/nickel transport system permease protein